MKRLRYLLEAIGLVLAFGVLGLLPVDTASNLGGFLGRNLGPRLPATERARRNLRLVFPDKDEAEIERIVRHMWDNLGRVVAEYPHLHRITSLEGGRVLWVDMDPVLALRDENKAGVLAAAHLANWEVLAGTAAQRGADITIVVREPNNPFVRPLIDRLRSVAGVERTPKGATGAKRAIELLRSGRILGLLYDQKLSDGIPVPLFGIEAMTAAAPAQLALRFRCPLVPVRIERTGPGRFRMSAHAPLELPDTGDRQADTAQIMAELNRILEGWIRAKPEEWLWLHRRWAEAVYREREAARAGDGG
jgi:KDO2-lipid IV(A) lauroyltransferase